MNVPGGLLAQGIQYHAENLQTAGALASLTGQSPADELKVARSGGFKRDIGILQNCSRLLSKPAAAGVRCSQIRVGMLEAVEVVAPDASHDRIVVYFHGGAHCFFSPTTDLALLGRLSIACRAACIAVDYRLAPHNPFPAGLEDALATYRWAREQYPAAQIAVAGDSAGGNLAFALLVKLSQLGERQPEACIGLSPWLLLDLEQVPFVRKATRSAVNASWGGTVIAQMASLAQKGDVMAASGEVMNGKLCDVFAAQYFQDHPASDPLVSPMLASEELVRHFPPILIHADRDEPLGADAREMEKLCKRAGVEVDLHLYTGTMHVFQALPELYPQKAEDSLCKIAEFANKVFSRDRGQDANCMCQ